MSMMDIGIVRMMMRHRRVSVPVRMRLIDFSIMAMLMVLVMHMLMRVFE